MRGIDRHLRIRPYDRAEEDRKSAEDIFSAKEEMAAITRHILFPHTVEKIASAIYSEGKRESGVWGQMSWLDRRIWRELHGSCGNFQDGLSFKVALKAALRFRQAVRLVRSLGEEEVYHWDLNPGKIVAVLADRCYPDMKFIRMWQRLANPRRVFGSHVQPSHTAVWEIAHSDLAGMPEFILKPVAEAYKYCSRLPNPENAVKISRAQRTWERFSIYLHLSTVAVIGGLRLSSRWRAAVAVSSIKERVGIPYGKKIPNKVFWKEYANTPYKVADMLRVAPERILCKMWTSLHGLKGVALEAGPGGDFSVFRKVVSRNHLLAIWRKYPDLSRVYGIRLCQFFGKDWQRWMGRKPQNVSAHDWVYFLTPADGQESLKERLLSGKLPHYTEVSRLVKGWEALSEEERLLSNEEIFSLLDERKFYWAGNAVELATLGASLGYSEKHLKDIVVRYLEGSFSSNLPDERIEEGGYRAYILCKNDPRGLFLGDLTNCCQHPGGVGASCAWHGQENPNHGFFVVESTKGDVISQSWVWHNPDEGGICFDSIESKGLGNRRDVVQRLYSRFAEEILAPRYGLVVVGSNPDLFTERCQLSLTPPSGYNDARKQRIVVDGHPTCRVPGA